MADLSDKGNKQQIFNTLSEVDNLVSPSTGEIHFANQNAIALVAKKHVRSML